MRRAYVFIVSLGLALVLGNRWAGTLVSFDPLKVAQNKRLTFQEGSSTRAAALQHLSTEEMTLAQQVLDRDRAVDANASKLLFVGNSQSLAIMDMKEGDLTTPQWLAVLLRRSDAATRPVDVRLGSQPNMTQAEALITLVVAAEQRSPAVDLFISAQVIEEYRGLGLRESLRKAARAPAVMAAVRKLVRENPDLPSAVRAIQPLTVEKVEIDPPWARKADEKLQQLADFVPLFKQRAAMQAQFYFTYYDLRNRALGLTTSTQRPIPEEAYRASTELVEMALRYSRGKGIAVIVYLAPVRPIKPSPTRPEDVARFRADLPRLCARYGARCLDLIDLVPEQLWTKYAETSSGTGGQADYAHFTGQAHKVLAEAIVDAARQDIAQAPARGRQP